LVPAVLEEFFDASEYKRDDFTGSHEVKRIETKEKARWVFLQFVGGELHMAVHNKRDFFDPNVTKVTDVNAVREKYREEMRYLTGIIDEVLLCEILS